MDLNFVERFIILNFRIFDDYISRLGFFPPMVTYNERDGDSFVYKSYDGKREIRLELIHTLEALKFDVILEVGYFKKKKYSVNDMNIKYKEDNIDIPITSDNLELVLGSYFEFIKKYLVDLIIKK